MSLALLLLSALPAHAACEDTPARIAAAERAIIDARTDVATQELESAYASLACATPLAPEQLARLWLAEAILATVEGRKPQAAESFVAAWRVAPDLWVQDYGRSYQQAREEAIRALSSRERGNLTLSPTPQVWKVWIDGHPVTPPVSLAAGLHAIQIGPEGGTAVFGRFFQLQEGEQLTIPLSLAEPPQPPDSDDPLPPPPPPPTVDPELLSQKSRELRERARYDWGTIDALTDPRSPDATSTRAERALVRFIERYGQVRVQVGGFDVPVEIPQAQAAQERLASLPARRAEEERMRAEREQYEEDIEGTTTVTLEPGFRGISLGLGAIALAAGEGQGPSGPGAFSALGGTLHLGAQLTLTPSLGLGFALGAHTLGGPANPSSGTLDGWEVDEAPTRAAGGDASAQLLLGLQRLQLALGPSFTMSRMQTMGAGTVSELGTVWEAQNALVYGPGLNLGASWRFSVSERLALSPALDLRLSSDGDRLYTWSSLGLSATLAPGSTDP